MIKSITGGQGVTVSNSSPSWPYFQTYNNNPLAGTIRYDGTTQNFMVYDGSTWQTLPTLYPLIELSPDVHELLQWAKQKRDQEYNLKELVNKYPTLEDAKKQLDKAKEQFDILATMLENKTNGTS